MSNVSSVVEVDPVATPRPRFDAYLNNAPDASGTIAIEPIEVLTFAVDDDASRVAVVGPDWRWQTYVEGSGGFATDLPRRVEGILDEVEATLLEDREEGVLHGEMCAGDAAVATCKCIAIHVASWIILGSPNVRWAAFGEDGGGACFVLRSIASNRRVDFRISPDGKSITAIRVNEHLVTESLHLQRNNRRQFQEIAAWVHGQS